MGIVRPAGESSCTGYLELSLEKTEDRDLQCQAQEVGHVLSATLATQQNDLETLLSGSPPG